MAMTKAEKKALEDLKTELALAWPRFEEPKPLTLEEAKSRLPSLEAMSRYSRETTETVYCGWDFNAYNGSVTERFFGAMGSRVDLGSEVNKATGLRLITSAYQSFHTIFATEVDAYRAMLWAMSREAANKLRGSYARLEIVEAQANE